MKKLLDVILLVQAYQLDIVNYRVFCGDFLFSCDSSSIRDNVHRSVGWSVGPLVANEFQSCKLTCCMLTSYA